MQYSWNCRKRSLPLGSVWSRRPSTFSVIGDSSNAAITPAAATSTAGKLITIKKGGSLKITRDSRTPVNSNVVAGSNSVHIGTFAFASQNSSYTIQEVKVKVPSDAATSVANVTLKYKNQAGIEQGVSQALALSSGAETHATATFTGLTMYVPQNDIRYLDVYVDTPTVASGAKSGAAISVAVDGNEGFKAFDSAGNTLTTLGVDVSSAAVAGYGTKYVKKSVPTLTRLTTGYTQNTVASGIGLYRFTITADPAGAVDWRKVSFKIMASGASFANWTLYDVTGTAISVNGAPASVVGDTLAICPGASCSDTFIEQIGAGSSKTYELRAGSVSGWGEAGDVIMISFAEDTGAIQNATAALLSVHGFVWSDRSAVGHSLNSSDWTNGYLIKNTDDDTRACQIALSTTCTPSAASAASNPTSNLASVFSAIRVWFGALWGIGNTEDTFSY